MIMDYLHDTEKMIILLKFLNIVKYQGDSRIKDEDYGTLWTPVFLPLYQGGAMTEKCLNPNINIQG